MPIYGKQDLLFQLQSSLLQTGDAGQNTAGHAFFRSPDDIPPPGYGYAARNQFKTETRSVGSGNGKAFIVISTSSSLSSHLPLRNNTPQGIFLSFYEWKRQAFPYCRAIRVDGGADGGNVVGIHGPGDGSVLGIDVADRDELRLDGPEDRHDFAALQRAAGDIQADLGCHAAAVHHAVQGAAGVRRFDIEAGPFDAVLGKIAEQRNAVDGKSVCRDIASHSIRSVAAALVPCHGVTQLAAVEVDADLLLGLRPVSNFRDGLGDGRGKAGEVGRFIAWGRGRRRSVGYQG